MLQLNCSQCEEEFPLTRKIPWCSCGGLFELKFETPPLIVDEKEFSMWRYATALPVGTRVSLGEPITPIEEIKLADRSVDAKLEFLFPTGSFKDRGSAVFVSALKDCGVECFIEDSSGNAGASIANYAARAGIACEVYCPTSASGVKIWQIEQSGAKIYRVPGPRKNATDALLERAGSVFYASHNWHPLFLHGTKTLAYEIAEQYDWEPPQHIVSPASGGSVVLGLQLGFQELVEAGKISSLPLLYAIQAEACAPLLYDRVKPRPSLAEGILSLNAPRLDLLRSSVSGAAAVGEEEIANGYLALANQGVLVEPTSAVLYFGVQKLSIPADDRVLVILTGSGLKSFNT